MNLGMKSMDHEMHGMQMRMQGSNSFADLSRIQSFILEDRCIILLEAK